MARLVGVLLLGFVLGACSNSASDVNEAETTYGTPVDATKALPAPAVAAEESLYVGRSLAVDGRIADVTADGCELRLDTDEGPPLIVEALRRGDGSCAWQVPADTDGFAVAAGTLRVENDTLRLTANGVRVTPVRLSDSDS